MNHILFTLQQSVACFVLHATWQSVLLVGAAWCAVRLGKPQARTAHVLWLGTLALCVLLPLLSSVAGWRAAVQAQQTATVRVSYGTAQELATLPALTREPAWKRMLRRHVSLRNGVQPFAFALTSREASAVAAMYLAVTAWFALRMFMSWRRAAKLVRQASTCAVPSPLQKAWEMQCAQAGVTAPAAYLSRNVAGPVLAGAMQPTLLLPVQAVDALTGLEMSAVLAHEIAHLRRHDPVLHALCSLALLPVCFHPAALWAAVRIRQTREMACDAEAAEQLHSRAQYARALLHVAERAGNSRARFAGLGLFYMGLGVSGAGLELFGHGGDLEERMQTILNVHEPVHGRLQVTRIATCVTLAAAALVTACMVQVQPALAGERNATQAASADAAPQLISGEHTRLQLQHARSELDEAQAKATSNDTRKQIATAKQVLAAAEQQLDAADTPNGTTLRIAQIDTPEFREHIRLQMEQAQRAIDRVNSPEFKRELQKAQAIDQKKIQAEIQHSMDQLNSPEFQASIRRAQQIDLPKLQAQMDRLNSPEFREQIRRAQSIDPAKLQEMMDRARRQAEAATVNLRLQQQSELLARMEPLTPLEPVQPIAAAAQANPLKVDSKVMAANVLLKKQPIYPAEAKEKKIQGEVLLHVLIGEDGKVEQISVVHSPDELLSRSALEAVREWTYKPYLLNGDPRAVETTVTVTFTLAQ